MVFVVASIPGGRAVEVEKVALEEADAVHSDDDALVSLVLVGVVGVGVGRLRLLSVTISVVSSFLPFRRPEELPLQPVAGLTD